jgi:peptidyl-prolyl cis-trans isomerase SurA
MTTTFSHRPLSPVMSCSVAMILACVLPASAQTLTTTVHGEAITEYDIEQRTKLNFLSTHKQAARQGVIDELADDKNKIMEAAKLGVGPTSVDVDGAFAQMCSRMRTTPELLS